MTRGTRRCRQGGITVIQGPVDPSSQDHEARPRALLRPSVGSHVRQEELSFPYPGWETRRTQALHAATCARPARARSSAGRGNWGQSVCHRERTDGRGDVPNKSIQFTSRAGKEYPKLLHPGSHRDLPVPDPGRHRTGNFPMLAGDVESPRHPA